MTNAIRDFPQFMLGGRMTTEQELDEALALIPTSTSIQASSYTPRDAPPTGLVDGYDDRREVAAARQPATLDPPHVDGGVLLVPDANSASGQRLTPKVSSPELASLAAKYVSMSDNDMWIAITGQREIRYEENGDGPTICADVRRLAASVLSQAEGGAK